MIRSFSQKVFIIDCLQIWIRGFPIGRAIRFIFFSVELKQTADKKDVTTIPKPKKKIAINTCDLFIFGTH